MKTATATKTFEFAHFKVKEQQLDLYKSNYPSFEEKIKQFSGFENLKTFQNVDQPNEILDFATWESAEAAEAADKQVQTNVEFQTFFSPIEQILLFENTTQLLQVAKLSTDDIDRMALNVYTIQSDIEAEFMAKAKNFYQKALLATDELREIVSYKSNKTPNLIAEVIYYKTSPKFTNHYRKLELLDEFKHFIGYVKELKLRKTFKAL